MANSEEDIGVMYQETLRTIEGIKSATEHTITVASDEAKAFFDATISQATSQCEAIGKSMDKESKKAISALVKESLQNILKYEKETIRAINDTWSSTKDSFNAALNAAKTPLGKNIKNLEKNMKDIIKYLEKIVAECIKLIKEFSRIAQGRLNDMGRLYLK